MLLYEKIEGNNMKETFKAALKNSSAAAVLIGGPSACVVIGFGSGILASDFANAVSPMSESGKFLTYWGVSSVMGLGSVYPTYHLMSKALNRIL